MRRARTFEEFDTHATARLHGFEDAWDYWRRVSSGNYLARIRRPTLLIAAQDDPFCPGSTHPLELVAQSPHLYSQFPVRGGHVGFISGPPWRMRHWAEEQIERFFGLLSNQS